MSDPETNQPPAFVNPFADPYVKLVGLNTPVQIPTDDGMEDNDVIQFPEPEVPPRGVPVRSRLPEPTLDFDIMGELIREWINECYTHLSAEAKARRAFVFVRAFKVLAEAGFTTFNRDAVIHLSEEMPKRYYHNIVRYTSSSIRGLMKWLMATGRIDRPIGEFVKWGKGKVYERRGPITVEEYARLKNASDLPEVTWMLIVGWHTGFAGIDCATLDWSDINMTECVIRKKREKTAIPMINYFDPASEFGVALRQKYDKASAAVNGAIPTGPVEPRLAQHVRPMSGPTSDWNAMPSYNRSGYIRLLMFHLFKRAGITDKSFHCFRTRWATEIVNNGVNLVVAAQTTGHKSVQMLAQYVRPDAVALKAAAAIGVGSNSDNRVASSQPERDDTDKPIEVGLVYTIVGRKPKLAFGIFVKYFKPTKVPQGEMEILGLPCDVDGDPISLSEITVPRLMLRRFDAEPTTTT